jgi:hypothetical protein
MGAGGTFGFASLAHRELVLASPSGICHNLRILKKSEKFGRKKSSEGLW